jgi:hypothetical protein
MRTRRELASLVIEQAFQMLADNVRGLRVDEALFVPPCGYRSTLGTLKHIAGWSHVYRSYAFDAEQRHAPAGCGASTSCLTMPRWIVRDRCTGAS